MAGAKPSTALRNCKTFPENCSPPSGCVCVWKHLETRWYGFVVFWIRGQEHHDYSLLPTKTLVIRWWYWDWSSQRTCKFVMVKLCSFVRFPCFGQAVASNSHETSTFRMNQFPLHFRPFRRMAVAFTTNFRCRVDLLSIQFRLFFDSFSTYFRWMSDPISTIFRPINSWRTSTNFGLKLHPDDWLQ